MISEMLNNSLKQFNKQNENHGNNVDINQNNNEMKHLTKVLGYNLNKIKKSENSTHVTGKNSCIETEFYQEMKRYYVDLKHNLSKIDRIQEETAIKMNRLYKESRKLARRSRNEKKQSLKFYRIHSSKFRHKVKSKVKTTEEEKEEGVEQQQKRENQTSHDLGNELGLSEIDIMDQSVLSPFLPVSHSNKIVSLTSNQDTLMNIKEVKDENQNNNEMTKSNISLWLNTINEDKGNTDNQVSQKSPIPNIESIKNSPQKKYSTYENNNTRSRINYSIIKHKEDQLRNLKAALIEIPIAYQWKDNFINKKQLKTKLICSKYNKFNLQAKRCLPGSVGGVSNYFLEVIALPKPALIRFPPPTSMHKYKRRKMLLAEKQQMKQSLFKLNQLIEEMRRVLEGQKLMAALKFLLASPTEEKKIEDIK
ncbi:hypothetical protein MN116_004803 [Schistosoma mekongi]|uniref:Uncharacterized protein n=1 Tax=Schistosoma mekongi TaxID=38744 RepID=A0AAE2D4X4_SCHME|nr:hypothetical protein MN116_004803 [Schistosoma mekongi]